MIEKDLSKCQCDDAGWCDLFQKEMTSDPPNWQWCQSLSETQRENYYKLFQKSSRGKIIKYSNDINKEVNIVNFYDDILPASSDYAVCVIAANEYAFDHLIITRHSIRQYAIKCGADYIELTGDQYPDWPIANKYRVHQVAKKYKKTLYLDCDVVIKSSAPNIFDLTPNDKLSICSEFEIFEKYNDLDWIAKEQEYIVHTLLNGNHENIISGKFIPTRMYNAGVMVIPQQCADLYKQPELPYPKIWCFDQHYISLILQEKNVHLLSDKFNTKTAGISTQKQTSINPDFWDKLEDAYFIHVNGMNKNEHEIIKRKNLLAKFSQGNYSKPYIKSYPEGIFITNEMLINDTLSIVNRLPKIKGILGIPRSGMIPASILAVVMSVPLYSLSDGNLLLLNSAEKNGGSRMSRYKSPTENLPILVIDDTSFTGVSINNIKNHLKNEYPDQNFLYTTVYSEPLNIERNENLLNIVNIELKEPHILEWNFFDAYTIQSGMFDLDGVFCPDCTAEIDSDEKKYIDWILNIEPFKNRIPKLFHPMAICTGRLEKYRTYTEAWLKKHNIQYGKLLMWQGTKEERDKNGRHKENVSEYKCDAWKNYTGKFYIDKDNIKYFESKPRFFVESCDEQAKLIAKNKTIDTWVVSINKKITY